ncbi:MAG: hypothetical protein H7Y03_07670, partial [Chitinophagaceae bacterium]|nr:hypothetical protein [Chitinophagaceae bacterium]
SFVDRMLKLYGDKPVLITEWNMKHGYKNSENTSLWASDLSDVFGLFQTKPTIKAACLYRLLETENERGWPGLIKAGSYEPKEYFYAMYKNWR